MLSPKMQETIEIMKSHNNKLIRWDGGFWTYENCITRYEDLKTKYPGFWDNPEDLRNPVFRGNMEFDKVVPVWNCNVKTLRSLQKRGLVVLDEVKKVCFLLETDS